MKKTIFLAFAMSALTITATYAQDTPAKDGKEQTEKKGGRDRMSMYDDLNLSQDQKDKIKKLDDEIKPKMQAIRDDASLSDDDKKAKSRELMKDRRDKVNEILTPEQKTKLEEKMKKMREERGNRSGGDKS